MSRRLSAVLRYKNIAGGSHQLFSTVSIYFFFISNYALQPFKAYCAIWVRRSNFRHQASPRVPPHESTHRRKVELWARKASLQKYEK